MSILLKINLKEKIKKFFLYIINPIISRTEYMQELDNILFQQYKETIRLRFKLKIINNEKINILFICQRPQFWGALKTVFESCNNDPYFNVTIITIPNKIERHDLKNNYETYISDGAENYFKKFPCKVINGYNYENKSWVSLRNLSPDYIFFQTPFSGSRPHEYDIKLVSQYANVCYVSYASDVIISEDYNSYHPFYFLKYIYLLFCQTEEYKNTIKNIFCKNKADFNIKSYITGFPKYDNIELYRNSESPIWKFKRSEQHFRIIWTPRWTTKENTCHFFVYKDKFFEYADKYQDIDFIFRPHPHCFIDYLNRKEITEKEIEKYINEYKNRKNMTIDYNKDYLPQFYSSDVLVTDISSIIIEYFLTGKPIIYCHKTDLFNSFSRKLSEGFYFAHNWNEVEYFLEQLKSKNDPLKEKREQLIKSEYNLPPEGAGQFIKSILLDDFLGKL